ncbi:MAG: hypothetical protein NZM25_02390 [Leptospiraceae bacterium]|nr:hypothetical protein [Leptospiraceae bacterium]MDW8307681.1 hypothetical protein [Leptospiraceae bacterium]
MWILSKKLGLFLIVLSQLLAQNEATLKKETLTAQFLQENHRSGDKITLRLFYQAQAGNYLYFYRSDGLVVILAFRPHKWDYSFDEHLQRLNRGYEYEVHFFYEGVFENVPMPNESLSTFLSKISEKKENLGERKIRQKQKFVLGRLENFRSAVLDDLRF